MSSIDIRSIQAEPPQISEKEFQGIILFENERVLALDKPGWLVCHPSKDGPGSSLVGAAKRYLDSERLHLVSRLDRETSGIVVLAKDRGAAREIQMSVEARRVQKSYQAIVEGVVEETSTVEARILPDKLSDVRVKMTTHPTEKHPTIRTHFHPLRTHDGKTLCRVTTDGGRKHQIRVHAQFLGHPLIGDKLYGHDETLYLEFCRDGWTDRLSQNLSFHRQALHCDSWELENTLRLPGLESPMPEEMKRLLDS